MQRRHISSRRSDFSQLTLAERLRLTLMLSATIFVAMTMPGCGGCSCNKSETDAEQAEDDEDSDEEKEKEKEKPKPDFEIVRRLRVVPHDDNVTVRPIKPGHWVQCVQDMRANNFDLYADLQTETLDRKQQPLRLGGVPYHFRFTRPTALVKGEPKQVQSTCFIPQSGSTSPQQAWMGFQLLSRRSDREIFSSSELTSRMPGYQYFFVVLADNPSHYSFLKRLHSISPPQGEFSPDAGKPHYRVVLPQVTAGLKTPLPDNLLTWTSIAYVLWDAVDPDALTPQQQTALVDWLHWGGQIIISGPDSLDALQASFLARYLPARKTKTREFTENDFEPMNREWSVAVTPQVRGTARKLVLGDQSLLGVDLENHGEADYLPGTGRLVAERQVGRGRVVVTSFPIASRPVTAWAYRDGFFNACLLRRPGRRFVPSDEWSPPKAQWLKLGEIDGSPLLSSTVRFFSRDTGSLTSEQQDKDPGDPDDTWHFGGYRADPVTGVGGWNQSSGVAEAAQRSLKDAAGISTPSARFVLTVLAAYLVVLVPVNWGLFRLIGRVEWAWISAPIIAIVGAVIVVRSAQLDIGFVRSRTEVSVLELHADYPRGHLTRFTALYSSLSTTYDLSFEDRSAQLLPMAAYLTQQGSGSPDVITVREEEKKSYEGYKVRSNTTGIVRSEQMYETSGPIRLLGDGRSGWRVVNSSGLDLRDVGVVRRNENGRAEVAWIGRLDGDAAATVIFKDPSGSVARLAQWNDSPITLSIEHQVRELLTRHDRNDDGMLDRIELKGYDELLEHFDRANITSDRRVASNSLDALNEKELIECCRLAREGQLRLGRFFDLATEQLPLGKGECRMMGWSAQSLEGVKIRPAASQASYRTFVLVHLRAPRPVAAQADQNHFLDVATAMRESE